MAAGLSEGLPPWSLLGDCKWAATGSTTLGRRLGSGGLVLNGTTTYRIPVDARNFQGSLAWINGTLRLPVVTADLVRAAAMLGYPSAPAHAAAPGTSTWWAAVHRMSTVKAYLAHSAPDRIVASDSYRSADQTEKGAISYFLAMVATKLASERLLGVVELWHWDAYRAHLTPPGTLRTRPDLLGKTRTGRHLILEAKGRLNGYPESLVTKAKQQAGTVGSVEGHQVAANVAAVAWMDRDGWSLRLDDPEPTKLGLASEEIAALDDAYYQQLRQHLLDPRSGPTFELQLPELRSTFTAIEEPSLDLFVGLHDAVLAGQNLPDDFVQQLEDMRAEIDLKSSFVRERAVGPVVVLDSLGRAWSVGPDGVLVHLGETWSAG